MPSHLGFSVAAFPTDVYSETVCGGPRSTHTRHSVYSESPRQRRYLAVLARRNHLQAPGQTCCSHHASTMIDFLRHRIVELAQH